MYKVFATLAVLALIAGCGQLAPTYDSLLPSDLPAALRAVAGNPPDPNAGGPLANVAAGTVVNALNTLDGCWLNYLANVDTEEQVNLYTFYHFDLATGQLEIWSISEFDGVFPVVAVEVGTYATDGPSTIVLTITTARTYNPLSQTYDASPMFAPLVLRYKASLADTQFKIAPDDSEGGESWDMTYTRSTCPS
jgi:hypothetical protein